jgi:putative ABC transport system permease protein
LPNLRHSIAFRLTAGANTAATLKQLADAWQTIFPGDPFDYHFLDASIARLYENEIRFSWLVHAVTILAIAISCMGLLGLILFLAERKKKEISIRKVLGAGIADIIWLLNKEFAGLIGIALLIATPIAGYGVHRWLENYAYQTTVSWWVFVLAGFAALAITALTISYRVIRAARANPVDNLRI